MTRRAAPRHAGWITALVLVCASAVACGSGDAAPSEGAAGELGGACVLEQPEALEVEVIDTRPHDPSVYTQGLLVHDGVVFESGGRYGESRLLASDLDSGELLAQVELPEDVFAEGLTLVGDDELVQLTWKEGVAFRWSAAQVLAAGDTGAAPVEPIGEHRYDGEGWGLTTLEDGALLMSDGSDELVQRDPEDFTVTSTHVVSRADGDADALNELEWDGESVWANRYQSDELLRIDPECWTVTGVADLSSLRSDAEGTAQEQGLTIDVVNGVAHLPGSDEFLVTGKWWPTTYRVTFTPS